MIYNKGYTTKDIQQKIQQRIYNKGYEQVYIYGTETGVSICKN